MKMIERTNVEFGLYLIVVKVVVVGNASNKILKG
jgi:hypothetical protein